MSPDSPTKLDRATGLPERWLQEQIHWNLTCLRMDQIEPGIGRLIPVCMELPLSVGNLVMVEVKLWSNPEARRKVVAQVLGAEVGLRSVAEGARVRPPGFQRSSDRVDAHANWLPEFDLAAYREIAGL